jgi:predicted Zn-dependent peptidase
MLAVTGFTSQTITFDPAPRARVVEHETAESTAGTIGLFEILGGFEHAGTYADQLLGVSPDDVVRVTERYLDPANASAVTYGPRELSHGAA